MEFLRVFPELRLRLYFVVQFPISSTDGESSAICRYTGYAKFQFFLEKIKIIAFMR